MSRRRNKNRKRRYSGGTDRQGNTVETTALATRGTSDGGKWVSWPAGKSTTTSYTKYCDHVEVPFRILPGMTIKLTAWHDMSYAYADSRTQPDLGLYLDSAWGRGEVMSSASVGPLPFGNSAGNVIIYPWPDASSPRSMRTFSTMIEWLSEQLKQDITVETGCLGAHGRTGSLVAALLIFNRNMTAQEAIATVRREHCTKAVETHTQEVFLKKYENLLRGVPLDHELPRDKWVSSYTTSTYKGSDQYGRTIPKQGYDKFEKPKSGANGYDTSIPGTYQYYDSKAGEWKTNPSYTRLPKPVDRYPVEYNDNRDMNGGPDPVPPQDDSVALDHWLMEAEERAQRRLADQEADREIWESLNSYELCPMCDEAVCPHPDLCDAMLDEFDAD